MNLNDAEKSEFTKTLVIIIEQLKRKGLLPPQISTKELAENVATKLNQDDVELTLEDIKKPEMQKALGLACMALCNPNNKFDITILFKNLHDVEPDDLKNQLKNVFTAMMKLHPEYKKKSPADQEELNESFDKLAEKITRQLNKEFELTHENNFAFSLLAACFQLSNDLVEQRRQIFGVDTHTPGATFVPVQVENVADQMATAFLLPVQGDSFAAKSASPDAGVADPLGTKFFNILMSVADNEVSDALEEELRSQHLLIKSPFEPNGPTYS